MLDKLMAVPIETLFDLKQKVDEACEKRRRELFKPGRKAKFETNKRKCGYVVMMITQIGPKNIIGYEIDAHGNHLQHVTCRVDPRVLTPVFEKPKPAAPPMYAAGDRPQLETAGTY
ncbi:hypothetical protein [Duganella sp. FT27W]|uniref:hypothetical protein n=1 Tax=Duganella sp. FT27W TaxID=2654636 RepID=UPI00128B3E4E|nr:hypothetical protein [Duganella sp. FT27W]MPQ56249.1 hypothetical protein [Duganella sp. FT27W]